MFVLLLKMETGNTRIKRYRKCVKSISQF